MAHTHVSVRIHCIFTTKDRYNGIPDELQSRLWAFITGIARNLGIHIVAVGGTSNHVHLLLALPATIPLATAVQKVKANSSRWMHQITGKIFEWQQGYAAFSVSISHTAATARYIGRQREHHLRKTVEDELGSFIEKLCA